MLYRSVTPLVYTLSISIQATSDDLVYALKRKVYFDLFLADYLITHLSLLWLDDSTMKYTDNTWLLMSEAQGDVDGLCCLAVILFEKFTAELESATGIPAGRLPDLNISITAVRGRRIDLAGGRREWITGGATGVVQACGTEDRTGKVVIDENVRDAVAGKFFIDRIDDREASSENSSLYMVNGLLNDALNSKHDGSERFIYTAAVLGKASISEIRDTTLETFTELCLDATQDAGIGKDEKNITRRFNTLIASSPEYEFSAGLLSDLRNSKGSPDAATYALLIDRARSYDEVKVLVDRLSEDGIALDSRILTGVVAKSPDFATAKSWFDFAEKSGIILGCDAYNRFITKSPDFVAANALYDEMLAHDVLPNVATYNALISKSADVEAAKAWLKIMLDEDLLPNLFVFNRVIAKSPDYVTALEILNEISIIGIKPNAITYNTLVSKAPDYEVARSWIDAMNTQSVRPNVDTFVRLFNKDISAIQAKELLDTYLVWELQSEEPIQAAISTYQKNGRVDQALYLAVDYPHLPAARKLIREIMSDVMSYLENVKDNEAKMSLASYNNLIENAPFYSTAMSWLEAMNKHGVEPDAATYTALVEKAPDFETGRVLIELMRESGLEPGNDNYSALFSKNLAGILPDELVEWFKGLEHYSDEPIEVAICTYTNIGMQSHALRVALEYPQLEESRKIIKKHVNMVLNYLRTVCEESAFVDLDAYAGLIAKAPYYDVAESWLGIMKSKGVKPDVAIYNTLIVKAPNYETVNLLLNDMTTERVAPSIVTFGTLIARSPSYEIARQWFKAMRKADIKPNVIVYSALISKAPDYPTSKALLGEMKSKGIKPNVISYNAVIGSATDYATAKDIVDEMFRQKVQPNVVTFNRLFSKSLTDVRAADLLKWYSGLKYNPDDPIQAAISTFRKTGSMDDARYLATRYPGLAISKKVMAEYALYDTKSGSGQTREFVENAKKSATMKQCLRIMDGELSASVGI